MPIHAKKIKPAGKAALNKLANEFADFENETEDQQGLKGLALSTEELPKKARKRTIIEQTPDDISYSDLEEDEPENGSEIEFSSLLKGFGNDIKTTLNAKRKRIQSFTQGSLKASNKKFDEIWNKQQKEREQHEDFSRQVMTVLNQWEIDLQKTREAMEKLESLYQQQTKLFNQQHAVQTQRLKRVVQLHEDYTKGILNLKKNHEEHKRTVHDQLRKEISGLQKKILSDTQQQDFTNVRRSLETMLAQV
ncbi:synaptonemal complex protein 3-like [Actinia tenebrosa]|uniref:Synaptonemal complex protein 3-like n=1 Tax=Actinia tenebrosa TaxID=6105 RepID=A0A6P8HN01_ACTTE|nr:synaptonemal complex protein 3-like [Actinia tenebrosa]